ncbi:response regulator [Dokdonella sp.]|uniref:response regulator n=1 Tax=Dokdonella sp. TaxID=2291710 RepID=UPI001B0F78AA|nr:response regulator [Dokdonella sp.]MBO9662886.1 response regulator [Dokdonella sp.]
MHKILLVDDEYGIQAILDTLLSDAGYRTVLAGNGKQAVELFRTERPDLVLMDWMMPIMDGPTAARLMQAQRPEVPLIIMSGAHPQALREEYDGFTAFIAKPFRAATVLEAIDRALRG